MTGYAAASSFGWLDYDEKDAARMREVLGAFDDRETVDSLGLGVIRDSFADQLFPGTSTIQTRARYFLFVPWIYRQLELDRVPANEFAARLREAELTLIDSLRAGGVGGGEGMFGYVAGRNVKRLPSVVYWNGLARYRIRFGEQSIAEHRARLAWFYRRQATVERDDDQQAVTAPPDNWDPALPSAPAGFPAAPVDLRMTAEEAAYLVERITTSCAGTLLAKIAANPALIDDATAPWEVQADAASPALIALQRHGRNFSDVMLGSQWLYNLLLARQAEKDLGRDDAGSVAGDMEDELTDWAGEIDARIGALREWAADLPTFWAVVKGGGRVPAHTVQFVETWIARVLDNPGDLTEDRELRLLIVNRERQLKGGLARLSQRRALENWSGGAFGGRLAYRWSNVTRLVADIANAGDDTDVDHVEGGA